MNLSTLPYMSLDQRKSLPACPAIYFALSERAAGRPYGSCNGRDLSSVMTCNPTRVKGNAATYPPALITPLILACTDPGGMVLDPFIGSGTTAISALECDRRCVGIDLSAEYLDIGLRLTVI